MSTVPVRCLAIVLTLALLTLFGVPATAAPDAFKKIVDAYKKQVKSPSFYRRMMAHNTLAKTEDPRALKLLIKSYGKLKDPREQAQYFVAAACGQHFNANTFLPDLEKWRRKYTRAEHAWLWYQTLLVDAQHGRERELIAHAQGNKSGYLRAAAVEALATLRSPEVMAMVPAILEILPKNKEQRIALTNSLSAVLLSLSHEDGSPAHHGVARTLMDLLDQPGTPEASKIVIARTLQRVFDVPYAFLQGAPWRQILGSVQSLMEIPPLSGKQVGQVTLGDVKARGNRICYLIDYSESSKAQTSAEDERTLAGKTADPQAAASGGMRMLAMRAAVIASVKALSPEQSFAVIYHRHGDSGLAPGCRGMLRATPKNIETMIAGLRTVQSGGDSDLHTGLRMAFATTEKGVAKKHEYVDKTALLEGCDTIFLVTQSGAVRDRWVPPGNPSSDPKRWSYEDRQVRGIYSDERYLADELRRWNMFRKAQIHVIPIGEAPRKALENLIRPYRGWNTMKISETQAVDQDAANAHFSAVKRQYDAYQKRPSLFMRMRGRERLARTKDPRALDIFARNYADPEPPTLRIPHVLVSLASRHFNQSSFLPRFHEWRAGHAKARDAWLWFRTGQLDLMNGEADTVEAYAREHGTLYLKLAAARAVASRREPACVPLAAHLLASLPPPGTERALTLEATAALLTARGHMRGEAKFAAPCEALIEHIRDKDLLPRTRNVIARHLAKIFRTDLGHGLDADRWLRELKGAQGAPQHPEPAPGMYAPFEFMGIPSAGGRVCYVVDASDSMLEPISDEERRILSQVVTGASGDDPKKTPLPWDRIHNRFDVAREYIKASLRTLKKDKSFAVILFGTRAKLLPSTPSLVAATPDSVRKAVKDLDSIEPGPKRAGRPHGTLRGFTNLHGGLALAFRLTGDGLGGKDPYVEPKMLAAGVDTIFLLSDGDPSMDDYASVDRPETGDAQADPETRAAQEKVPDVTFYGPYVEFNGYLLDDVRRMNLFRNAAIHCVGIGEADMLLLRELAAAGMGETKRLGKD